jgi:hypothetical protein
MGPVVSLWFAEFEFLPGTRQLVHRGADVLLSPKAFELLSALIDLRPNAVSKKDLQDAFWPSTFVAESNLAALVNEIRHALRDQAARPKPSEPFPDLDMRSAPKRRSFSQQERRRRRVSAAADDVPSTCAYRSHG